MKFLENGKIDEVFKFRHACKKFDTNKSVSEADFRTILEAGRLSPSSFGFEPWKFLVLRSKEIRQKIYDVAWGGQDALNNASEFVAILARVGADLHPNADYISYIMKDVQGLNDEVQKKKRGFFESFQKDDFCIYNDEQKLFDWACKQCYIVLGNMLTSAALLGIDSLPIEGFSRQSVNEILQKEGLLDTKHFSVAVMTAFGYRKNALNHPQNHPQTRQSFEKLVQVV